MPFVAKTFCDKAAYIFLKPVILATDKAVSYCIFGRRPLQPQSNLRLHQGSIDCRLGGYVDSTPTDATLWSG
jgi:hypothetical protein